ncbi:hypothetical protein N1027_11910 [Herbiconiux sp. CPCC 205763]|uniref:Integral membrane protein n=1 Tax=Herbiconiux aconitum TaxID=2970913 RepID=A0ABT2GRI4_9MICO|nr:hypothetical protein [Herbiconiux aconitum]MCS5718840.1 hypothetical protein [Herbiconiux aconitum]
MTNSSADDTTEQTDVTAHASPRRRGIARLLIGAAVVVVLVLGLAMLAGHSPGLFVVVYLGYALAILGVPYTVVALVVAVVGHRRIAPSPPTPGPAGEWDRQVQNFELFPQRASLVLAVVLLLILVVAGILVADGGGGADLTSPLLLFGGPVVAGAVFTIGANVPQLYRRRVIALERHAVATCTGRWRLIVLSWVLSPLLWIAYPVVTVLALVPAILGG